MLKIKNLYKSFNLGEPTEQHIFQGLNLEINEGECTALIGGNGCGKSTLMNIIAGSIKQEDGYIELDGEDVTNLPEYRRSKYIARVHQNPSMGVSESLTILENLAIAEKKSQKFRFLPLVKKSNIEKYKKMLESFDLGLEDKLNVLVKQLSGGQRQSLSLLMAVMHRPKLLLLDEHTAALDPKTSKIVMDKTLDIIKKEKMTTIMITHNMMDAINYADRVIMLEKGEIILDNNTKDITEETLYKMYRRI